MADIPPWPSGCHNLNSCERHRVCMYHQCVHTGKGAALAVEIRALRVQQANEKEQAMSDDKKPVSLHEAAELARAGLPVIPTTPVLGYTEQTAARLELVNLNKELEELVQRRLDASFGIPDVDPAELTLARRRIQEGFMWFNRAIMRPKRIPLPEDALGSRNEADMRPVKGE